MICGTIQVLHEEFVFDFSMQEVLGSDIQAARI